MDFQIDNLRLTILNASGQEHRIAPVVERAAAVLADCLDKRWQESQERTLPSGAEGTPSGNLDLSTATDEQAANVIAEAWLETLARRL